MRGLRSHLTYANVMVTLLAFIVLASGGAYAANTVFSSDIVNGEVKAVDIGAGQVAGAELAADAVGTHEIGSGQVRSADIGNGNVQSPDVLDDGLTGTDIAESTLQNIDAATIGGRQLREINFRVPFGTSPTVILDLAGLQITAECQNFGDVLDVKAFTTKDNASIFYFAATAMGGTDTDAIQSIGSDNVRYEDFDIGDQLQIDDVTPVNSIGWINYWAPDGSVVTAQIALMRFPQLPADRVCQLTGTAVGG